MTLKLNGSTDGSVSLQAPADTSPTGTDKTFTLPTADGTSGQVLATNGSGALSFANPGTFTSYAIICDQKAQNTQGGTATNGAHRTRDLNTEIADPDGIVSISSNQFTLQAGSYLIEARAPGYDCHGHQTRLYNATTSTTIQNGTTGYSNAAGNVLSYSVVLARVVITGATAFEIQHRVATTKADTGFGVAFNVAQEIYTTVKIYKEA